MVDVVVLGSLNADLSASVERIPAPGETVLATGFLRSPGGKGGNQAVAAARAGGADVAFVGAVGTDGDGDWLLARLEADGIDTAGIARLEGPSGMALISVDRWAENSIVVVPGANAALAGLDAAQGRLLREAAFVLAQLETPLPVIESGARTVREAGGTFVLNAAPSQSLSDELLELVDVLVVNEHEARDVSGEEELQVALEHLAARCRTVVLTRGARGSSIVGRDVPRIDVPAHEVTAVDTTAAGDTYCGVLVAARSNGLGWEEAARVATRAAGLTVARRGAQDSIPTQAEIQAETAS